ncbi:tautomerase PptA [Kosakonia quasisacchari]|uniref:tautomerase PptA n=1 Tax=Kosakonia quasisacchari TaxID=2529380 RepID=UPI0039E1B646
MPHVDIKCFPRDLSEAQKTALANDIAEVIVRHLSSKDSAVSVALNTVAPDNWKAQVWDTDIAPHIDTLIKNPGYSM